MESWKNEVIITAPAYGWLFLDLDSRNSDGRLWKTGKTRRVRGNIVPGIRGFVAYTTPYDALHWASGSWLA